MTGTSRREFLRKAALSAVCADACAGWRVGAEAPQRVRAWVTAKNDRFREISFPGWQSSSEENAADLAIDPSRRFQSILGFGGAFTDASCYLMSRMGAPERAALLRELFGPEGLGFSVGRTCIGASDYSCKAYSFDDASAPDPDLKAFSIDHDRAYILPVLRESLAVNPDLYLFATPWSPPGWMKTGGELLGGSMHKQYLPTYAQYFLRFLDGYRGEGVKIRAVTVQNEVDTDQEGRMPACLWGQEYEIAFIKEFLGPAFRAASLDTKIWLLDHNYDLWGRAMDELSDPGVFQFVDGVAWHGYAGEPDAMTRVHEAFPSKGAYFTEYGPLLTDTDYLNGWAKWSATYTQVFRNWARCAVAWNLLLDEKGGPNLGPFACGGVVTLDSATRQLTRSGQYWALAHYSKTVQRGAQVMATTASLPGVEHVAFANPDGTFVLVLTNQAAERGVRCSCQGRELSVTLPADSVLTLQWV